MYNYGTETWGDLTGLKFTLQFFIRQNSSISASNVYVASILDQQTTKVTIEQKSQGAFQLRYSSQSVSSFRNQTTSHNWLEFYITQKQIHIANSSWVNWFSHGVTFNQQTRINILSESETNYWQGYACCIIMYKGTDILDSINRYFYIYNAFNQKTPTIMIDLNVQEKLQSNITYDYSEYNNIIRLGDQYNYDVYDPYLVDGLLFNATQYLIINDILLNPQFTFEFRISQSSTFTSNVILLKYSSYITISKSGDIITYQYGQDKKTFTLQQSNYYHFCIGSVQDMEESQNIMKIFFYQFSDTGVLKLSQTKITPVNSFQNGYGTMYIGSSQNQFNQGEYFQIHHFRFYSGFYFDDTSAIDIHCSVYLIDRCIICNTGYVLTDLNTCESDCLNSYYTTVLKAQSNQCVRKCHPTCSTCFQLSPQICLTCNGIRIEPPQCTCPVGYYDDYVSPNCRKYIPEQSTQIGGVFINCTSISTKLQIVIYPYSYSIVPQVLLQLSGVSQQDQTQPIDLFANQISNIQFTINVKCSFINQFYNVYWISFIGDNLIKQNEAQIATTSNIINIDQTTGINYIPYIQGWTFSQSSSSFSLLLTHTTSSQYTISASSQLSQLRSGTVQTNYKSYSYTQVINNPIVQVNFGDIIPKSIKLINLFQGVQSSIESNVGTFDLILLNRNQKFLQFYSQQQVSTLYGTILLASKQCQNTTGTCDFYESTISQCNLQYSLCQCNEINYFLNAYNLCEKCDNNCQSCQGVSTFCTLCYGYQNKQLNNGKCECLDSQYLEINNNTCINCHPTCLTCFSSTMNSCKTCKQQATLSDGSCNCDQGYYFDYQTISCQLCHINCQTCSSNQINACLSCDQTKFYNIITSTCSCLNQNQFLDTTNYICIDCHPTCSSCYSEAADQCISCDSPRVLYNSQCLCSKGYYEDDSFSCKQCQFSCEECVDNLSCTKCPFSRRFDDITNGCVCSDGYYQVDQQIQCSECPKNCQTCNNQLKCESCFENQLLIDGKCECKPEYYQDEYFKCLSCNTELGLLQTSCNIQNCGDGQWTPSEQCDDGNLIDRDGCTNCKIDTNYQCSNQLHVKSICFKCQEQCKTCKLANQQIQCDKCNDGFYLSQNKCIQCGDNCKTCESLTFCTECPIEGTSPDSNGECPQCEIGYQMQQGQCLSKCGDGIQSIDEECDLGASNGQGGCTIQCKQQDGFTCSNNICNMNKRGEILVDFVNSFTKTQIAIDNHDISTPNLSYCQSIQVNIENFDQTDFNKTLTLVENKCNLILEYKKSIKETNLIHILIPIQQSQRMIQSDVREIVVTPRRYIYSSQDQIKQAQSVSSAQDSLRISLYFLGPLAAIVGGFDNFMTLLDILAWINNLYYLNIQFSANVLIIFQTSIWDDIQLFPQTSIPSFNQPFDQYYTESPPHFMEKGTDPLFINNSYQSFGTIALYILVVFIAKLNIIISKFVNRIKVNSSQNKCQLFQIGEGEQVVSQIQKQNKSNFTSKFIQQLLIKSELIINNKFSYFIKLLNLIYLDLVSAITLQLSCFKFTSINYSVILLSYIMALTSIVLCLILISFSYYVSMQPKLLLNHKGFESRYGTLYEGIKINNQISMKYSFINLIRKTLFIISVVGFYYYPLFQTGFCCFISFINIGFILYQNPFNSLKELVFTGIPDLCIFFLMLLFTLYAIDDKVVYLSENQRFNMGWLVISIILISILVQISFLLAGVYGVFKERLLFLFNKIKLLLKK